MSEHIPDSPDLIRKPGDLSSAQLAMATRAIGETLPEEEGKIVQEAATQVERLQRLNILLGKLAPGGTAPRTLIEELWRQTDSDSPTESPAVLELRGMLETHWGQWGTASRAIEGLAERTETE